MEARTDLEPYNLAIFLSLGMSLKKWQQCGILERELDPINLLANYFGNVYIFSYGGSDELEFKENLAPNITIVPNSRLIKSSRYQYLIPLQNKEILKECHVLKTEQMSGAKAALISKLLNPQAKLVVRAGYSLSFNHRQQKQYLAYIQAAILEFLAYRFCNAGLVTSKKNLKDVVKKYHLNQDKIHLIANYINTDIFKPREVEAKYTDRVLYVGRISQEKNLASLVKALKGTKLSLDIIGRGELESEVRAIAKLSRVNLRLMGVVSNHELPGIINRYKIFVQPSFYEGMPKTLLEAMACGLACVGTNVPGIQEVIKSGENGLLSQTDSQSLGQAITKLINDPPMQKRLGEQARQFVKENFSLKRQIKKELKIYERLIIES